MKWMNLKEVISKPYLYDYSHESFLQKKHKLSSDSTVAISPELVKRDRRDFQFHSGKDSKHKA